MPLPWKKAKVSRIYQFVADFQSPKRGGSLVVETGFPTSLIDLFVKNRDRLKKSSKRKSRSQIQTPEEPSPPSSSSSHISMEGKIERVTQEQQQVIDGTQVEKVVLVNLNRSQNKVNISKNNNNNNGCCDERRVLVAVLKIFLVVVLAMSTKKLVVVITMSAFVLLFLEYVWSRAFCFMRPCPVARRVLDSLIHKGFRCRNKCLLNGCEDSTSRKALIMQEETISCGVSKEIQVVESNCDVGACCVRRNDRLECLAMETKMRVVEDEEDDNKGQVLMCKDERSGRGARFKSKIVKKFVQEETISCGVIEEIQVVESNCDVGACCVRRNDRLECLAMETKVRVVEDEEDDNKGQVLMCEDERSSRGARFKSKIVKKFVPKKLRGLKKGENNKEKKEVCSCELGDEKLEMRAEAEEKDDKYESSRSHFEEEEAEVESCKGKEFDVGVLASCELLEVERESDIGGENVEMVRKGNSGYLILFLIVLAGLVGGKVVALVLTVAWCLMSGFIGRVKRSVNVPMIR